MFCHDYLNKNCPTVKVYSPQEAKVKKDVKSKVATKKLQRYFLRQ